MILSEHVPSAPLNTYIKALRYSEGPTLYQHLKMLPSPALNLMISFDGAFNCYKPEDAKPYATYTESWSIGLWNTHHILDWPRNMQLLIVDFKPGGAYPFLHLPLSELHNNIVSLDAIWGNLAAELRERLYNAPTIQARFGLFGDWLMTWAKEVHDMSRIGGIALFVELSAVVTEGEQSNGTTQGIRAPRETAGLASQASQIMA